MREAVKNTLPRPLLRTAAGLRDSAQRALQWPSATFHPWRRESIARLTGFENRYRGERCFILGNGPSLQRTDVPRLRDEFTFGMNRVYLTFEGWGFQTSFLVAVNSLVIEQCRDDFQALHLPKFFSWRAHRDLYPAGEPDAWTHFLHTTYTGPKFARDARGRLWEGATVTFVCLQLAFFMGFETAILLGVDHHFSAVGPPNQTVVSQGDDPDHFAPGYFGKGFRWQLPDLATSEVGYRKARDAFERAGRQVLDATVGGQLQVFEKRDFEDLV